MVRITIISLIYRSPKLADWVHDSAMEMTPSIQRGEAHLLFVANDPTEDCLRHLETRGYDHIVNVNPRLTASELYAKGYGAPEHMNRVYRGYNAGIRHASTPLVVLVNSDNYFSVDWLENMEKYMAREVVVTARLVEPGHPTHSVFPDAVQADFGRTPEAFDREGFLRFAESSKATGLVPGGAYMPCMLDRDMALQVGLYPEGNLAGKSFEDIREYGDEAFYRRLKRAGVRHYTALDSIVYHLKEGELGDETSGLVQRRASRPGQVPRAGFRGGGARVVVCKKDRETYLGVDRVGFHRSEVVRLLGQGKKGVSRALKDLLPGWLFDALRSVWRAARGTVS